MTLPPGISDCTAIIVARWPPEIVDARPLGKANHLLMIATFFSPGGEALLISGHDQSSATNEFVASPAFRWSMLFVGLATGFLGMDIMVRRPMMRELASVRTELSTVERDMEELVGVRNQVWETNNLLTSLKSQYRQLEDARVSMSALAQLRSEIETEAGHTGAAFAKLDRLVGLQNAVLRNTENVESAEVSLNRMVAMQGHLVESGQNTTDAMSAINQLVKVRDAAEVQVAKIDNAYDAVQKFGELKNQIMTNGEGLDIAQEHVAALAAIKNDVFNEAGDVAAAHEAARNMIALKNDINEKSEGLETAKLTAQELFTLKDAVVSNGGNTEAAFANTERLFTLRDALIAEADLDSAEGNLTQLVEIQDTLNRQTAEVADAVETLEVLTDLNDELQTQVTTIDGMRKSLLDVVLMESTVRKVAGILEPLAELSNLRRLSNDDMREAARVIMDQRTSRVASRPAHSTSKSAPKLELNDVELFTDEQPKDIFVPLPKDLDIDSVIDSIE
ncbi:MAG: hypothetical protein O2945_01235 [Planctomycetota bacterium]|nr:hypothetical protein [Planctomycetota bacterium]MDA0917670.1 hypothetical protein [Planctomycetota bacterium]